jgi:hypothetical protein
VALQVVPGRVEPTVVSTSTALLAPFVVAGLAAVAVLAPRRAAWRGAAEHARAFWLAWIIGGTSLGFAGPATFGLGWVPLAWFAFWTAVGALQPSMVSDLLEVRRLGRRQLATARRPAATPTIGTTSTVEVMGLTGPPPIRWQPPPAASVPAA